MVMNTLYLVRHGENLANINHEFSYRKVDYWLTERGVQQAEQTAAYFAALTGGPTGRRIDAIYSSPLKRAAQTARIIGAATGHDVAIIEEFREINCGDFDGAPPTDALWEQHDDILRSWRNGDLHVRFPGGEDYHTLLARVRSGLSQAVAGRDGHHVVIVAHGGIVGASLKDVCPEVDHSITWTVPNRNCAITEIELHTDGVGAGIERARGILKRWAACDHLAD